LVTMKALNYRLLFSLPIILLLTTGMAFAQVGNAIPAKFDSYRKAHLEEKIYVHTDRSSYLIGETLWFKIYITDASLHKPLGLSKVAYIEILDETNDAILQTKVNVKDGHGSGSVFLPATINSGNYTLSAYTNWMKNEGPEFYFHKTITIVNTFKKIDRTAAITPAALDVRFFPEGGNLISGISSKVAFRAVNNRGDGVDFKGYLLNERNDTLAAFRPLKFGIGHFTFVPSSEHTYRVIVQEINGKKTPVSFPSALPAGYALQVIDSLPDKIAIRIRAKLNEEIKPTAYLFIHARNVIVKAEAASLQPEKVWHIDKRELPEGISHITIFDSNENPVCERLYFKQPENLNITLNTEEERHVTRRRVRMDLETSHLGIEKSSTLSVAVYKTDSIPEYNKTITEHLWLTSDLHGQIESPGYYFTAHTPEVKEAIDNLMLSHGWRRFRWSDVLNKKEDTFSFLPEYQSHIVRGLVKKPDGSPAPGVLTYLASPGKSIRVYCSRSNKNGEVFFDMRHFEGDKQIIIQTNPKVDSIYKVEIVSPFSDEHTKWFSPPLILTAASEKTILTRSVAMQIQDIYFRRDPQPVHTDSSGFYGVADETYLLDDYTRFPVMEEVMREYVRGVLVRKRKDGFHFRVVDKVYNRIFDETPLILIDGVPLFDADEIMALDPLKVKKIEVMTRTYYLSSFRFPGVVSYTTYTSDLAGLKIQPNSVGLNYEGLQLQREFYTPRYESPKQRESRIPDQRTLLYWNPDVQSTNGKKQIEFFTSDIPGEYKIVVEGITSDGHVGSVTKSITVNEVNN